MQLQTESLEKLRQLFDDAPYPRVPLEQTPREDWEMLFIHSLTTAFYLRDRRVVLPQGKVILDAGCGSGYKALMLAVANPGARIVGVDLSEASVDLARKRLEHHGLTNVEFHAMAIEELPRLGQTFDYINCDETLYLLPDPLLGLQVMPSVLKPDGILRINLHNTHQRQPYYCAQELFGLMGLMDAPVEMRIPMTIEAMQALKPNVLLRATTWNETYERDESALLANHLLDGDKGFTIPKMFELLDAAGLDLIRMVNWSHWEFTDLFQQPEQVAELLGEQVETLSQRDRLHLYELLHPVNRLMDFWCTPNTNRETVLSPDGWQTSDWQTALVTLHPQLTAEQIKTALRDCIQDDKGFEFNRYINLPALKPVVVHSAIAATLLLLWDGPQPMQTLIDRYLTLHPLNPVTLAPLTAEEATRSLSKVLMELENHLYVLLERPAQA